MSYLVFFLLLCLGIGWLSGTLFVPGEWYAQQVIKPSFNPPDSIFAPVWVSLFIMMAVAAWLVWRAPISGYRDIGLRWWFLQLGLNALWSAVFFGLHRPGWALLEISILWVTIAITALYFWRANKVASVLLIPYLVWVSFASILNLAIWRLNGGWF